MKIYIFVLICVLILGIVFIILKSGQSSIEGFNIDRFNLDGKTLIPLDGNDTMYLKAVVNKSELKSFDDIRATSLLSMFLGVYTGFYTGTNNNYIYYNNQIQNRSNPTPEDKIFISKRDEMAKYSTNMKNNVTLLSDQLNTFKFDGTKLIPVNSSITLIDVQDIQKLKILQIIMFIIMYEYMGKTLVNNDKYYTKTNSQEKLKIIRQQYYIVNENLALLHNKAKELGLIRHIPRKSSLNNSTELQLLSENKNDIISINTKLSTMNDRINNIQQQLAQQRMNNM